MKEQDRLDLLLDLINKLPPGNHTIAIDGRCAAGKSTLAAYLAEQLAAGVVHMDDFYLPLEMRTDKRLAEPGGNVYRERFLEEVIPHLNKGKAFSYQKFDCSIMALGDWQEVSGGRFTIVEGAYSCLPALGEYMSLRIFMDVESQVQLERIRKRNGEERAEVFRQKWIPMEEAYFEAYAIKDRADVIL